MRPRVVQRAAVLMHMDERFAALVHAGPVRELHDDERALLTRVDARAFRTDPERPLRLLAALLEEYPVSCAVVGAGALTPFVSSSPFRNAVFKDRLVVDAFGDWLFARAGAVAQIELAVALARRRRPRRSRVAAGIARAPGVELARVPVGTLAFYAAARAQLGPDAHRAVAAGARIEAPRERATGDDVDRAGERAEAQEHLIATPDVATCAEPLFALLSYAREGRARADLVDEARRLGADDDAASLVDDLLAEGLLAAV